MKRILLASIIVVALLCVNTTSVFSETSPKVFRKVNPDPVRWYEDDRKFYFIHEVIVDSLNCTPNVQSKSCGGLAFIETEIVIVLDSTEKGVSSARTLYMNPRTFFRTEYQVDPLKHMNPFWVGVRHTPGVMTQWGNTYNPDNHTITSSVQNNVFFGRSKGETYVVEEKRSSCTHGRVFAVLVLVIFFTTSLLVRYSGYPYKSDTMYLTSFDYTNPDDSQVVVWQTVLSFGVLFFVWMFSAGSVYYNYPNVNPPLILIAAGVQFVIAIAYGFVKRDESLTFVRKRLFVKIFIFLSLIALFVAHYGLVGEIGITWNLVLYVTIITGVVLLIRVWRPFLLKLKDLRSEIHEFGLIGFVRKNYSGK